MNEWAKKDPMENFEQYLKEEKVLTDELIEAFRADIKKEIIFSKEKWCND